jgi:ribonucleotide monophosphatase NagD (HAD superfamily)
MFFNIDFDGTCVKHEYPKIGAEIPNAANVLKRLTDKGHQIILFTMRSGKEFDEALKWFEDKEIKVFGKNTNPTQSTWTKSPKSYAHVMIDDSALGCPLVYEVGSDRPYVDWFTVETMLEERGLL